MSETELVGFDREAFRRAVRRHAMMQQKSGRQLAPTLGLTHVDLSRAKRKSQPISVAKVIALCLWMRRDILDFFICPESVSLPSRFTCNNSEAAE